MSKSGETTDDTGIKDDLVVELNNSVIQGEHTLPPVPAAPTGKNKTAWRPRAVALGLDPVLAEEWDLDKVVDWCGPDATTD